MGLHMQVVRSKIRILVLQTYSKIYSLKLALVLTTGVWRYITLTTYTYCVTGVAVPLPHCQCHWHCPALALPVSAYVCRHSTYKLSNKPHNNPASAMLVVALSLERLESPSLELYLHARNSQCTRRSTCDTPPLHRIQHRMPTHAACRPEHRCPRPRSTP